MKQIVSWLIHADSTCFITVSSLFQHCFITVSPVGTSLKSLEIPWFAPVLGKHFKMGETAVITAPAGVEEKEAEKMTEDRIIKNIPKAYQIKAKN